MAASEIAVSTTPPLPGTVLVQQINDAFEAVATQFSGAVDPAAYAGPYMLWADTNTGNVKRRNAANSAWDIVGRIVPTVTEDSSGNVGIGTSSPTNKFWVYQDSGAFISSVFATNQTASYIAFRDETNSSATSVRVGSTGNNLSLFAGGSERARIDSSGNLLVGTTTAIIHNTTTRGFIYEPVKWLSLNSQNEALLLTTQTAGAVQRFYLQNTGDKGSIAIGSGGTAYNTTSDYRLKENVEPMTGALEKVAALKPCKYTWKTDGSAGQGFIAHELQEVVPDCVTGEKDAVEIVDELDDEGNKIGTKEVPRYQGVDTSFLVATLVAAIQELKADFDAYKAAHP
jgi:hypothetical protein